MKFAGVQAGKNRGEIVELNPDEKAVHAAREGAGSHPEHDGHAVILQDITIAQVTAATLGDKLREKWANKNYVATGSAQVWLRNKEADKVSVPKVKNFTVKFHDVLDVNGLPDLAVDEFELEA